MELIKSYQVGLGEKPNRYHDFATFGSLEDCLKMVEFRGFDIEILEEQLSFLDELITLCWS